MNKVIQFGNRKSLISLQNSLKTDEKNLKSDCEKRPKEYQDECFQELKNLTIALKAVEKTIAQSATTNEKIFSNILLMSRNALDELNNKYEFKKICSDPNNKTCVEGTTNLKEVNQLFALLVSLTRLKADSPTKHEDEIKGMENELLSFSKGNQ